MRLIDADVLEEFVWRERLDTRERIANLIDRMPTVELPKDGCEYWDGESSFCALQRPADSVRHWKWIKMSDADGVYFACGMCGESLSRFTHYDPQFDLFPKLKSIEKTNYCPHCGVRMEVAR